MINNQMVEKARIFWSDNWWREDDVAWFVGGEYAAIFQINLRTKECRYIAEIPEKEPYKFRKYPRCVLCGKDLYCLPDTGDRIWVYHVELQEFSEISLEISDVERVGIYAFWKWKDSLLLYSSGLQQLIEIDLGRRSVKQMTPITDEKDGKVTSLIRIDSSLWGVDSGSNKIYEYRLDTGEKRKFILREVKGKLRTICYDGEMFWLSGDRREIYIWNPLDESTKLLNRLPDTFGIYNIGETLDKFLDCKKIQYETPAFLYSVCVNDEIWFIPFLTNHILYINKNTCEINELWIDGEDDEYGYIDRRRLQAKYCLETIRNGFIWLYSYKNRIFYCIDTQKREIKEEKYYLTNLENIPTEGRVMEERKGFDLSLILQQGKRKKQGNITVLKGSVGELIYRSLQ